MKLKVLFGLRNESYSGQNSPEALVCWTEFDVDENPTGFQKACEDITKSIWTASQFQAFKLIDVEVDQTKIRDLLIGIPSIKGTV